MRLRQEIQKVSRSGRVRKARIQLRRRFRRSFRLHHLATLIIICLLFPAPAGAIFQTPSNKPFADRERGIELYRQNRTIEAIEALRVAVKKNKEDSETWYFLGLALMQNKDLKDATKCFETAVKLQPQFAAAHAGLAYALLLRNKKPTAAAAAEAALRFDPSLADAYYILGIISLRNDGRDEALKHAQQVIKLRPQFAPAYLLKSQALVAFIGPAVVSDESESVDSRKQRYREAADALEKYLQLSPNAPNSETWKEQLASLKFAVAGRDAASADRTYSSKEVTTRARVLSKPEPNFTPEARQNDTTGTVILRGVFASDGNVKHLIVIRGLPDGLTEVCIKAARRIKFIPATLNGRPVATWMELQYNFSLF
jgi:cytochrome c-type biogenesis protein CcmH/NrfG